MNPGGEIVWSVEREELPGIKLFWVTQLQILPNGNVVITNTHAGGKYPQLIEVNRKKEVVWSFLDWKRSATTSAPTSCSTSKET